MAGARLTDQQLRDLEARAGEVVKRLDQPQRLASRSNEQLLEESFALVCELLIEEVRRLRTIISGAAAGEVEAVQQLKAEADRSINEQRR